MGGLIWQPLKIRALSESELSSFETFLAHSADQAFGAGRCRAYGAGIGEIAGALSAGTHRLANHAGKCGDHPLSSGAFKCCHFSAPGIWKRLARNYSNA